MRRYTVNAHTSECTGPGLLICVHFRFTRSFSAWFCDSRRRPVSWLCNIPCSYIRRLEWAIGDHSGTTRKPTVTTSRVTRVSSFSAALACSCYFILVNIFMCHGLVRSSTHHFVSDKGFRNGQTRLLKLQRPASEIVDY